MNDKITIPPSRYSVPSIAFEKAIAYIVQLAKPVYLGQIALAVDCNLSQAATIMEKLVGDGIVRVLTKEEKIARDLDGDGKVFVATNI